LDVRFRMVTEIDELHKRVDKIEKQNYQEVLTLVEIMSNATFFGEIKQSNCEFAKDGQCSFFILRSEDKHKIPIAAECRIKECRETFPHCHIEISNISCTLCQRMSTAQEIGILQQSSKTKKSKNNSQNEATQEIIKIGKTRKQK
jgi:hypothetical protein